MINRDEWASAGRSIFGTWLPYIGIETILVDEWGQPIDELDLDCLPASARLSERRVFMLAWFNHALLFFLD